MADSVRIRDYRSSDANDVNRIAVAAFGEFHDQYQDWAAMLAGLSRTSELSATGEIIVGMYHRRLAGAVAYFGPTVEKASFFDREWPIIRMLIVDPVDRGKGLGHALTIECIARAKRDRSPIIALHTCPIMTIALP